MPVEADSRLFNAVGLAMKAGKLQSGDFIAERLVRSGAARLVLIDPAASENTRDKYARMCDAAHKDCLPVPSWGAAIGKPGRMVAVATDINFSDMMRKASAMDGEAGKATRG